MEVFSDPREEEGLIEAAAGGDPVAFEGLFHRYYDMIHAYAYRMCYDDAEASDLAQETWIKVARSLPLYRGKASFKNWVHAVAHNVALDALRRKERQRRLLDKMWEEPRPEAALPPAEESDTLKGALLSLSPDLRAAVTLVYLDGLTHAEAGAVLGCAEATVSWRLFQARRKLRKLLSREALS